MEPTKSNVFYDTFYRKNNSHDHFVDINNAKERSTKIFGDNQKAEEQNNVILLQTIASAFNPNAYTVI